MCKKRNYFDLVLGLLIMTGSFNLFLAPSNLVVGVSGLALIIQSFLEVDRSLIVLIINEVLLIISYIVLGREQVKRAVVGAFLLPICLFLMRDIRTYINIGDLELIVRAVVGGTLWGIGYGLILKSGNVLNNVKQIGEKYLRIVDLELILESLLIIFCCLRFGFTTSLYAVIVLVLTKIFSSRAIIGNGFNKTLYIYSTKYEEITYYLHQEMRIDSTDFSVMGGYTLKKGKVILTVINTKDYYRIKESIKHIDENAFIVVTNAYHLVNDNVTIRS